MLIILFGAGSAGAVCAWRTAARARRDGAARLEASQAECEALRQALAEARADNARLAGSEDQLQAIVSMLPVALFLKDPDSRIVMMNEACEEIFGVAFAKLSGTRGSAHYPPEQMEAFLAADRACFASRETWMEEEWLWHAGLRENRRLQTYKRPMYDRDGKPALLIGMCIDVTDRMRADEALQSLLRQLRELSDHQETVREDERRRLAQHAHDTLGQNLMALKLDAAMLHAHSAARHPRLHAHAGRNLATLDDSIAAVRGLINDLHPLTLELGLPAAVEWLLKQLERRSGIVCQLHLPDGDAHEHLTPRETWAIFRLIQEGMSHIAAYADAGRVDLTLEHGDEGLRVTLSHNGANLKPDGNRLVAFGVLTLRERVAALGGRVSCNCATGPSNTITVTLPGIAKREAEASRSMVTE
ncbi:PAS domain-containing sensor histidine kinase [Pseudoduganella namucuonensis]|nr:PAS domain-containing protein [Pseudoduganella namucuonensis]